MTETIALGIASVVQPFLTKWLKGVMGDEVGSGKGAFALTLIISFLLTLGIKVVIPGELAATTPEELLVQSGSVFTISQMIYKFFMTSKQQQKVKT